MQTITQTIPVSHIPDAGFSEQSLFFDIETTGFSPSSSFCYQIGCAWREGESISIRQYFADRSTDEKEMLASFGELLLNYSELISFNGIGFDLPFLKGRFRKNDLSIDLDRYSYIDLFKDISGLKNLICLENYKQKTVERFLGIDRQDLYTGGELIDLYRQYEKKPEQELLNFLLLHNYEDMLGMLKIYSIRNYYSLLKDPVKVRNIQVHSYEVPGHDGMEQYELLLTLESPHRVPRKVRADYAGFFLAINEEDLILRIPIYCGELKFFYENYKDYYYLPQEDRAIHKSLAGYVDKDYREKCHASNCYTCQSGTFLPQLKDVFQPVFRRNLKDKISYFEMKPEFFQNQESLQTYIHGIFQWIRLRV